MNMGKVAVEETLKLEGRSRKWRKQSKKKNMVVALHQIALTGILRRLLGCL